MEAPPPLDPHAPPPVPPRAPLPAEFETPRPGSPPAGATGIPKTFGILSIVFAALTGLGNFTGSWTGLTSSLVAKQMEVIRGDGEETDRIAEAFEAFLEAGWALSAISFVFVAMSVWLLVVGIAQMRYRRWAAGGSVVWAVAALAALAGILALHVTVVGPALRNFVDQVFAAIPESDGKGPPPGYFRAVAGVIGALQVGITLVCYAPYPIVLLVVFRRDRIRAAMTT